MTIAAAAVTMTTSMNITTTTATAVMNTDFREEEIIMRYLTVALAKGRLAELAMELFISIGMDCSEMKEKQENLFSLTKNKMKFILVKASDVPTYVEYGAADIGIVGKDTLLEESRNLYEMVDLGFENVNGCMRSERIKR